MLAEEFDRDCGSDAANQSCVELLDDLNVDSDDKCLF